MGARQPRTPPYVFFPASATTAWSTCRPVDELDDSSFSEVDPEVDVQGAVRSHVKFCPHARTRKMSAVHLLPGLGRGGA